MLEVGSLQAAWELNFLNLDFFTEGFCFGPGLSALLLELTNTYRTLRVRVAVLSHDSAIDRVSSVTYTLISTPHFVPLPLDRKKQDTLHSVLAGLLTMPIPTPPPENPGVPVNLSWMNHTIPTHYFDVNKRIEVTVLYELGDVCIKTRSKPLKPPSGFMKTEHWMDNGGDV